MQRKICGKLLWCVQLGVLQNVYGDSDPLTDSLFMDLRSMGAQVVRGTRTKKKMFIIRGICQKAPEHSTEILLLIFTKNAAG